MGIFALAYNLAKLVVVTPDMLHAGPLNPVIRKFDIDRESRCWCCISVQLFVSDYTHNRRHTYVIARGLLGNVAKKNL